MRLIGAAPSRLGYTTLILCLVVAVATPGASQTSNTVVSVATETSVAATSTWRPTGNQTSAMQQRLKELGFNPGPLDGSIGPRTQDAIRRYQRSVGLTPDGKLTRELYDRIITPPVSVEATPEPSLPDTTSSASIDPGAEIAVPFSEPDCGEVRMWRFVDSFGSSFDLALRSDGSVEGPTSPGQWSWRTASQGVEIVYDNGMGQRVTRVGRLQGDDRMAGEATDSNGRAWDWSAERTIIQADGKFDCQTSSSVP